MENLYHCLGIIFFIFLIIKLLTYRTQNLPPSPFSLPIIGHLHLLKNPLYQSLATLLSKYGPILYLRLGCRRVLVISSSSAVEEIFTKNDIIFANRPRTMAGDLITYNYTTFVWAPYGPLWRNLRRLSVVEIFSSNSVQKFSSIREEEVTNFVRRSFEVSAANGGTQKLDLKYLFGLLSTNVMVRMVAGKRGVEDSGDMEAEKMFFREFKNIFFPSLGTNICDFFPILRWIGFQGIEKELEKLQRTRDEYIQNLVDGIRIKKTGGGDKAFKEGQKYCNPKVIWSGKSEKYVRIPSFDGLEQSPNAKYLHICANETIYGVEFKDYPVPSHPNGVLVADMSSNFCSKPVDVTKFGLIYAGAQKNVGPAGVCIVIIRKDLIGNAQAVTPVMLDYKIHAENNSLYNTPPCFGIYVCGLVFEDLLKQGGLEEVEKKNKKKAGILYNAIDESKGFYRCPVEKSVRSLMNVPFTLEKSELEADFLKEAAKEKMVELKGHRSVGGMRASIYNAMPLAGVEKLVAFMKDFQARHA